MTLHSEHTIREQLRALIRLQHIDTCIDNLKKERGDLPNEIRDLEDAIAGLNTRIRNTKKKREMMIMERRRWELCVSEAEALIKRYEDQQPLVRNNREYDALSKEIDAQRVRIDDLSEKISDTDGLDEDLVERITEAQTSLEEHEATITVKRSQLEEVSAATEQKLCELEGLREVACTKVDPRYQRAYEGLRRRLRDGRAVVKLQRGAAGGYTVPPQRQVEIRQRNRIIACEHTGRIIVDADMYAQVTADLEWSDSKSFVDQISRLVEESGQRRSWSISK